MAESHQKGKRSADYRIILNDDTKIGADLYDCTSDRIDNITSYISSKFDQADTIVAWGNSAKTQEIIANAHRRMNDSISELRRAINDCRFPRRAKAHALRSA